jgi:hypothetical protein
MGAMSQLRISVRTLAVSGAAFSVFGLPAAAETTHVPSHLDLSKFPAQYRDDSRAVEHDVAPAPKRKFYKVRKVAILRYKQPLRVGNNEMLLKVRAPGSRKSFVSMELVF